MTVIGRTHQREARAQFSSSEAGKLIVQPANRDTAAGIYLALTYVRAQDAQATVVLYPSDHFVYPEDRFVEVVRSATQAARQLKNSIFLLGVSPDGPEPEYGWIHPGAHLGWIGGHRVRATEAFLEKPSIEKCRTAMASGALWNTLILAARVETLWEMGWQCFPEMMPLFERYGDAVGTSEEESVLEKYLRGHAGPEFFLAFIRAAFPASCGYGAERCPLERLGQTGADCRDPSANRQATRVFPCARSRGLVGFWFEGHLMEDQEVLAEPTGGSQGDITCSF